MGLQRSSAHGSQGDPTWRAAIGPVMRGAWNHDGTLCDNVNEDALKSNIGIYQFFMSDTKAVTVLANTK